MDDRGVGTGGARGVFAKRIEIGRRMVELDGFGEVEHLLAPDVIQQAEARAGAPPAG